MKLHYKVFGNGESLIILHGLFGMLDNWRTVARKLEDKYQCILVDLRNHGKSPHADEMNYKVLADDVNELIDDLQLQSPVVLGHSMGGKTAMQLALTHPESMQKIIVVDISPTRYPPHHEVILKAIESVEPSKLKERLEAEEILRSYLGDDEANIQFLLKNISRKPEGGFEWKANMPVLINQYDDLMDGIHTDAVFDKPALFIRGEHSNSLKDEDWPVIVKLFPHARLVTIANAGHWVHADQPQALIDTLMTFMES